MYIYIYYYLVVVFGLVGIFFFKLSWLGSVIRFMWVNLWVDLNLNLISKLWKIDFNWLVCVGLGSLGSLVWILFYFGIN